jgi:hypothetical protein
MKKILTATLCLAAGTMLLQAQGLILLNQTLVTVHTNSALSTFAGGTETGGTSGNAPGLLSGGHFYYQLLLAPMSTFTADTHSSTNPLASGWYAPAAYPLATNTVGPGTIAGSGGALGGAVATWANGGASATSDTQGTELQFLLVGWSANLGTSWTTVSGELAGSWSGNSLANQFFGVSQMGFGYSGGGQTPASLAASLFGVTTAMPGGLSQGFSLFEVIPVPEPSTMALAGLGGLSLLLFRRRK